MNDSDTTSEDAHGIAAALHTSLSHSLQKLDGSLTRVQRDLDLGCKNLHDLVNSRNPAIRKQLGFLQEGLSELHENLTEVRSSLAESRGETAGLKEILSEPDREPASHSSTEEDEEFDQQLAAKMRHDEPVTLGGILRALLMADAPEQRM